jgi:hypothetical protein
LAADADVPQDWAINIAIDPQRIALQLSGLAALDDFRHWLMREAA